MNTHNKIKTMTSVALSAAILCVLGPLTITLPISPVPISFAIFGIFLSAYVLGAKWGCAATLLYLLIGFIGVPVFSNFSAGAGKLFGPTGGYLIGYILTALIAGFFVEKFEKNVVMQFIGLLLGTVACYALGTVWLAHQASMDFKAALFAGVIPFIPGDVVKIIIAVVSGRPIRKALKNI